MCFNQLFRTNGPNLFFYELVSIFVIYFSDPSKTGYMSKSEKKTKQHEPTKSTNYDFWISIVPFVVIDLIVQFVVMGPRSITNC